MTPSLKSKLLSHIRSALTLIEIMIALTMTLVVLGAMMTAFQFASREMQNGRAALEMANQIRVAEELLRNDLANIMIDPRTYTDSTNPNGYVEIVEGPKRDSAVPYALPDSDGDLIPNLVDVDSTGGSDVSPVDGVDDALDPTRSGYSYLGDHDDIICATVRSPKRPFRGRYVAPNAVFAGTAINRLDFTLIPSPITPIPIESPFAEVVWWTRFIDNNGNLEVDYVDGEFVTLYRRLLLIVPPTTPLPSFGDPSLSEQANLNSAIEYLAVNDISARIERSVDAVNFGTPRVLYSIVPNTAKDLAHRRTRWGHNPSVPAVPIYNPATNFPFPLFRNSLINQRSAVYDPNVADTDGDGMAIRYDGNDIVLNEVAAFDVKLYSPNAGVIIGTNNVVVEPGDVGFQQLVNNAVAPVPTGAYVDLGHAGGGWFSGPPNFKSRLRVGYPAGITTTTGGQLGMVGLLDLVYDTWTPFYESDGIDQDGVAGADQGNNGVDDQAVAFAAFGINAPFPAGPDDQTELETMPPYPHPVRAVKVSIRMIERDTKQVRQASVIQSYVPE
jgi:type II secretory pathway pseudopilin PulG